MIKLEFTIVQINTLLNALNHPMQAGALTLAGLINAIHEQAEPQVSKEEGEKDGE